MIMDFLTDYGLFLSKAVTIVVAILIVTGFLTAMAMRQKRSSDKQLDITHLNKEYEEMEKTISSALLSDAALKDKMKLEKKQNKQKAKEEKRAEKKANKTKAGKTKQEKTGSSDQSVEKNQKETASASNDDQEAQKRRMFIIDFDGDIRASAVDSMREEISAILTHATEKDEVLVRLESGGGMVHSYGLAASQLQRIKDKGIPLTISVDKIAASGGYMMACVANRIIAAPFSIIGSIGVLAQIPNLHRLLKKHDIDYEQLHAGEYKRTLTMFGENTDKARVKMQEELEETHTLFKDFVKSQRPSLDIDHVSTGEHWLGTRALELGLVDELKTSDDYLMSARENTELINLSFNEKTNMMDKLSSIMSLRWRQQQKMMQDFEKPLLM
ncbi:MAG: protease SohB [Gammaproteobacteria bacterium]|nr:protease SohB [Gammaproteobacteria bacterium]